MNAYQNVQRDGKIPSKEELESILLNGTPRLSILCFDNADHGTTFGTLSVSQSNPFAKIDIPGFQWPVAPFPEYKYPLDENQFHNKCQDETCLSIIEELIYREEDSGMWKPSLKS